MKKRALTTGEIAKYCDVTQRTAIQWINEGKIKAFRTPGNHTRVEVVDFIKFLKQFNMPVPVELQENSGRKKILVVDDVKGITHAIKRNLVTAGNYDVEIAFDGFDAGRKFSIFKPDIVVLDIRMPGIDGYALTERIRGLPEAKNTKIIAMSAFFEEEGKEKIEQMKADAYLEKPFSVTDLLNEIEKLL